MNEVTHLTRLRSTKAIVDLNAVRHNIAQVRKLVGERVEILAVVKADAYGHGAVQVAKACQDAGTSMLGVALVDEGVELRQAGIDLPLLVQCCISEEEINTVLEHELTVTVATRETAERLSEAAGRLGTIAKMHADVDTGMGRIGFPASTAADKIARLARLPNVELDGVYTHFATSEIEGDEFTRDQMRIFKNLLDELSARGLHPPRVHACNSGAVINYPEAYLTLVRPGLILYGVYPDRSLEKKIALRPALSLTTSIVFLKDVPAGVSLGYGRSFVASDQRRIATANVGYADGYPWRLSNNGKAIVRGVLAPVVGRVSMDQLLVDVTSVPGAALGDAVTLLGTDDSQKITAEDLANWAGTIPYEILCGISKRVPRQYIH